MSGFVWVLVNVLLGRNKGRSSFMIYISKKIEGKKVIWSIFTVMDHTNRKIGCVKNMR